MALLMYAAINYHGGRAKPHNTQRRLAMKPCMKRNRALRSAAALLPIFAVLSAPSSAQTETRQTSAVAVEVTAVAADLEQPWAVAFLPDGGFLLTLRGGEMRRYDAGGAFVSLSGVPEVYDSGQGGLLDVLVPRDFADTGEIFFTFAKPQGWRSAGTALARARLGESALEAVRIIWEMPPGTHGGRHFGSRIVEGRDGCLYVTIGERGERPAAQDLSNPQGTVLRLDRNGRAPADNPFVGAAGALPEIWSYGHRNAQGAALDESGRLWVIEHGARGGDEVNLVKRGANYGWPIIAYGRHYIGGKIGIGVSAPGMEQPAHYWDPSIAPSGAAFYHGDMFPEWRGDLLVGALVYNHIARLEVGADGMARQVERIATDETLRVRDVRVAPDGSVWFLSVGNEALYRLWRR